MSNLKIKVIEGSTRPGRFNTQPARWIYKIAKRYPGIDAELVDLEKLNLPFLDEPVPPSRGVYTKSHTKGWAAIVDEADGFIFVTPEYNHSFSAVLKNAIDFLYYEWNYKPAGFVSYGSLAGGARAVEQLRGVMGEIKIYDLREQIMFSNYWDNLDKEGKFIFTEQHFKSAEDMLDNLVFWAKKMKEAREELSALSGGQPEENLKKAAKAGKS